MLVTLAFLLYSSIIWILPNFSSALVIPYIDENILNHFDNDPFNEYIEQNKIKPFNLKKNLPPILTPDKINDENRSLHKDISKIPSYVIDNCPLVHLYSEETYFPDDIKEYTKHFTLKDSDGNSIIDTPLSLQNLTSSYKVIHDDNETIVESNSLYMTSIDDFDKDPTWLLGKQPEYGTGYLKDAPAVLFVVDKGNGWVDAFWFYFYPMNGGPYIMGYGPWGSHVGDWEHSLVRFFKGKPQYLWLSAHSGGTAYQFGAIEKLEKLRHDEDGKLTPEVIERPLIFSARGTHANYASVGQHPHDVPFFFMPLSDFTDRGPLWDPSLNFYSYIYDGNKSVKPMNNQTSELGLNWLLYRGTWGDKQLPAKDPRQKWCPAQWRYIDGPIGPLFKNLQRQSLCQSIKSWKPFNHGCPARRYLKRGNGLTAERNDLIGDNCGVLLYNIRPKWLRSILRFVTWRGVLCNIMEYSTG
ncbi:hypothetical protein TBLA_0C04540 [Henningerozyma blattae CBS 6284]|uniref:Vacuolar protein sorting-associated protein 62 n=1 Tax=Henningerozyma blattae (strain ATCC 34711 / CBS 6284 / DSM 70876 / NBRC 10599 / NRRL Y-10934 / UCD 77-7) TaxID=1071380 RepID=I2H1J9_HENB6|nr:hypothetical protein TBLA_0C04540 [Tetrapisispora blattae CBS 6284]CCH60251.1 hypothetical protein TBLA_0C04540 [Tetrapisispora blattae CBS 6284]